MAHLSIATAAHSTPNPTRQAPESGLAPAAGTTGRYVLINWLNYLSSEVHATYGPLFNPTLSEEAKVAQRAKVCMRRVGAQLP